MQPEPDMIFLAVLLGDKEHLLAARLGALKRRAGQRLDELLRIDSAKNPLLVVDRHLLDAMLQPGVPLFTNIFDFS